MSWGDPVSRQPVPAGTVWVESGLGDYTVKGNLISRLAGKPVQAAGNITKCSTGDTIEEKSIRKIEETLP